MSNFKHPLLILMIAVVTISGDAARAGSRKFSLDDFPDLDWSGPYLGAAAGYLSSFKGTGSIDSNGDLNPNARGFTGSAYAGYNIRSGNFVYGPELDAAMSSSSNTKSVSTGANTISQKLSEHESASARGRFGYLFGDTLVYVTAGIGVAKIGSVNNNTKPDPNTPGVSITTTSEMQKIHLGMTFGLGVDYALSPSVIARTEYRMTRYEQKLYGSEKIGADSQEVRAGLAYKF